MPGLLRGVARVAVVSGTATAVSGNVSRRQQRRWAGNDAQQAPAEAPAQAAAPPSSDITDDQIAQLEKLGALKDKGVLTQAEFDQKKQQILGL